jgi:DNA-binding transcriptional LysR family regulator
MTNIPTDLLRTLVAIVDLRSFTKAAHALGVTQPAVSAQIKRLNFLLGCELLDKSTPGVVLTPRGETVVAYARRLLSINDQILQLTAARQAPQMMRVGIPSVFACRRIINVLADFRKRRPDVRFTVHSGSREDILRDLERGDLDLALSMGLSETPFEAWHSWSEDIVWVRSEATQIDPDGPVPLVTTSEDDAYTRAAMLALNRAGRDFDVVFRSSNVISLEAAVLRGFGVTVLARSLNVFALPSRGGRLYLWEDGPLPPLPKIQCGVYLREGGNREILELLAADIANGIDGGRAGLTQAIPASRAG